MRPDPHARGAAPFPPAQCAALFAAVLVHDDLHPDAVLPAAIRFDYTTEQLAACYRICRQLWDEGVDRATLREIITKIGRARALSPEEQVAYKNIRARFKHLRFAYAACSAEHRYPRRFHWLTGLMGNLQDAFKHGQPAAVARAAWLLRLLLAPRPYAWLIGSLDRFRPTTPEAFRAYVGREMAFVRAHLARPAVTSKEFHELRKVISRQVALYDNLKTLYPTPDHENISRCLSTINGLMGRAHDELIVRKFARARDYYAAPFPLPEEIRRRLAALVASHAAGA